jgi:hypothetical protein
MKSRHSMDGEAVEIRRGLHIYKVLASPFWRVRIRDPRNGKYIVRSTKEESKLEARKVAEEVFHSLFSKGVLNIVPREQTFEFFAEQVIKEAHHDVIAGNRRDGYVANTKFPLFHKQWGLIAEFGKKDVSELATKDYVAFINKVRDKDPTLSGKTYTAILTSFRKVMTAALLSGVITAIPDTPKIKNAKKEIPRTFFRFYPIVSKENDEYKLLLKNSAELAKSDVSVRGTPITEELRDIIIFAVHGFVRPTYSELYALKHKHVMIRQDKERNEEWLVLTIEKGKTGRRLTDTMPGAATVYRRIQKRHPNATPEDYLFLPQYENRKYAIRVFRYQFNYLLEQAGLKKDDSGRTHQVYDLRHTGLAMRTLLSKGKADLLLLAQNAGTSIEMLERFYLHNLPRSNETIAALHSFGD